MGYKLLWTGLTILVALPNFGSIPYASFVGSLVMVVGLFLFLINR